MGRGSQSVQEMKARSHMLLPVHTRVACVSLHMHVCACGWEGACFYACGHAFTCAFMLCVCACGFHPAKSICTGAAMDKADLDLMGGSG